MAQIGPEGNNVASLRRYLEHVEMIPREDVEGIFRDAGDIYVRCIEPGTQGLTKGLIYGLIQSGKTAVIIALLAIAADNGYRQFVVLTSDLNDLYDQTLDRIKRSLDGFEVAGKGEIRRIAAAARATPLVIVASKGTTMLNATGAAIDRLGWAPNTTMIIDDEADQASLNTATHQPARPASGVNRAITALRQKFASLTYVQTTATPQALLLQDATADFHPDFVTVTTPGSGYCGGDTFFLDEDFGHPRRLRFVSALDVQNLITAQEAPDSVAQSLVAFFVGAAILRRRGNDKNYTYLLHTHFRRDDHHAATGLVDHFRNKFTIEVTVGERIGFDRADQAIMQMIRDAYDDIASGFDAPPTFDDVLAEIAHAIASTEVVEINSRTGEGVSPNPARRHTIYVGGTKIGRGVTVKNLLVTYYGRDSQNPQVDTVLQHARMYGYRNRELPATRIYLPQLLAVRFREIHTADNAYRDMVRTTHLPIPVTKIALGMRPTRTNVLNPSTVELTTYVGGSQYFPMLPISDPARLGDQTERLNNILEQFADLRRPYDVSIDDILGILDFQFADDSGPGAWHDSLVRQAVRMLRDRDEFDGQGTIIIASRGSDLGKSDTRGTAQVGAVLPGGTTKITDWGVNPDRPALAMVRVLGRVEKQWEGVPFWLPLIRFPDGNYAFSLNRSRRR